MALGQWSPYMDDPYRQRKYERELERRYMEEMQRQTMLMAPPLSLQPAQAPDAPAPIPGKTLLVIGPYMLKHDGTFALYAKEKRVVTWQTCPTRSVIAGAVAWDRQQQPRVNAMDDYGYLLGVRYFKLSDDFRLKSPHQNTVWESNVLSAKEWNEEEVVRGKAGIHAAWPTRSGRVTPRIDFDTKGENMALVAKVRGFGKVVKGEVGWRSEKAIIDTVYLPSSLLGRWRVVKRLEKCYPEIIFEEETWTLERSSRSAK